MIMLRIRIFVINLLCAALLPPVVSAISSLNSRSSLTFDASQLEYWLQPGFWLEERRVFRHGAWTVDAVSWEGLVLHAQKGQNEVGKLGFSLVSVPDYETRLYLFGLFVKEEWRRKGIATGMITQLLAYIMKERPDVVGAYLGVEPSNEAGKRLYEKIGFVYKASAAIIDDGKPLPLDGYVFNFTSSSAANLPKSQSEALYPRGMHPLPMTTYPPDTALFFAMFVPKTE
ncbi:hypothetical protein FOZ62_025719 [Perkinsus olseni]|uniref:N-acetyltransferase domain-containing protein n=2 Tax=Perkinsus olseni TaxID=32597 RepID=A0A7J6QZE3_PEROL|nr:hypothetical protein FOZ62_025719 [Perkinsus olseni]